MLGLALVLAALAAGAEGAPGGAGAGPAGEAGIPRFAPMSPLQAAHFANPHDAGGKPLCQRCHVPGRRGTAVDPIALCSQCHDASRMKHPVGMAQAKAPEGLPLGDGGLVVCHTCHDPHDVKRNASGLRLPYAALCARCHVRHGARSGPAAP